MGVADFDGSRMIHQYATDRGLAFEALLMAAMREASGHALSRLQLAFPSVWQELIMRYNSAGGLLAGEAGAEDGAEGACGGLSP